MLTFIVELFLEFLIPLAGELLIDLLFHFGWRRQPWARNAEYTILTAVMYFGIGLFVGWLTILIFPRAFIRSENLHGVSLILTPVLAGLMMAAIGAIREQRRKVVIRLESFSYGFVLAFGMALVRFFFTE